MTTSRGALLRVALLSSFALSAVLLPASSFSASLEGLERVGPTNPDHGYPEWYQDKTGLTLEFCSPETQAELDGGWCLLLPGDTQAPETFPAPFADEHFYWAGEAGGDVNGDRALLVLGLEAAFAVDAVVDGDQVVFGRLRIRLDNPPVNGTYVVYTPYGKFEFPGQVVGERLFFTEDIGITCAQGQFDCALLSSIGPFLLPSAFPGGPEDTTQTPVIGPGGKMYIAAPDRVGPVTGSPVPDDYVFASVPGLTWNPNRFAIEVIPDDASVAPQLLLDTEDFTLVGRVFSGVIPGNLRVTRASYARSADTGGVESNQVDVFATGFAATQGRIPGQAAANVAPPVLAFYPAACTVDQATGALGEPANVIGTPMMNDGSRFWGQARQLFPMPTEVCLENYTPRDATGQVISQFFQVPLSDQVTITEAIYDPANGGSMSVKALSSDTVQPPGMYTLEGYGQFAPEGYYVTPVAAPPESVRVRSAYGGIAERQVTTLAAAYGGGGVPVAGNDEYPVDEDSDWQTFDVLSNDTLNGNAIVASDNPIVEIVVAPRLGEARVDAGGTISFKPFENANGTEGIGYVVKVGPYTSSTAYVTIPIAPVSDPPTANPDTFTAVANVTTALDVLANDVDVDGKANLQVEIVTPVPSGVTVSGQQVSFNAPAGHYEFTYQIIDPPEGYTSSATVIVDVAAQETITFTRTEFRSGRLRVEGTVTPAMGQSMTITASASGSFGGPQPLNGGAPFSAASDALGVWALDARGVAIPTGTNTIHVTVTGAYGGTRTTQFQPRR